ncbi:TPA: hypothetical protein HA265_00315 [Candidatus Woesearchaeota archaeon]|nr:hypothetical protein [Candidatus Woesearchaeota archaeon]
MAKRLVFLILAFILLLGCAKQPSCADPLVMIDGLCCRDENSNGRCDMEEAADERAALEEAQEAEAVQAGSSSPPEPETVPSGTEQVTEEQEPLPEAGQKAAQAPSQQAARKAVDTFAQSWASKQYRMMYSFFTDDLKRVKTADEFVAIMELNPSFAKVEKAVIKGIDFKSDTLGDVELEVTTNVNSYMQTDTKVVYNGGEWKIDGFVEVFYIDTFGASCGGFVKEFNKEACAKDLAIKLKDIQYCERSKCHYEECITTIKKTMTNKERVTRCNLCPPTMKNTMECIVDAAIAASDVKVCNEIPETRYSDRYCGCYGGFARAKNQVGYCNMIQDPDNKALCMKGFEGKYC